MLLTESLDEADPGGFVLLVNVPMIFGIMVNVFLDMVGVKVGYKEPENMWKLNELIKNQLINKNTSI